MVLEHKLEATFLAGSTCRPQAWVGWGLVQGHWVRGRQGGLASDSSMSLVSVSLSSPRVPTGREGGAAQHGGRSLGALRTLALGSNSKGSRGLLWSPWQHVYLFIMFEKRLQGQEEMLQSTEFYFLCRFILIPCGFPWASLSFLCSQCQVSTLHCLLLMKPPESHVLTHPPSSGLPLPALKPPYSCLMPV